ncbi:hypothetical protein [Rubrobacter indicoceani]|uniref:hypothetical protein n=1 Tax=Rubrobacter indicoceani TaxID=2051957 RepID=UPI000E5A134F|nr:hypothetical protein [Rubrobacter indicoceani]
MNLKSRLSRLEAQTTPQGSPFGCGTTPRGWERYFHAFENARREVAGLSLLSDLKYTEEDYNDDLDTLQRTIPYYRQSAGWQSETGQEMLDAWERKKKEAIEAYEGSQRKDTV